MSLLGRFAKLDSSLQRGLDNGFAFVFGGTVVPAEIEELLKQEVEDNLFQTDHGVFGPNVFHVGVSAKDLAALAERSPRLPDDFSDRMNRFYRNSGWRPAGPVVVTIAEESGLRSGQLRASSYQDSRPEGRSGFERIADDDADPPPAARPVVSPPPGSSPIGGADAPEAPMPRRPSPPAPPPAPDPGVADPGVADPRGATEQIRVRPAAPAEPPAPDDIVEPRVNLLLQDGSSRSYQVREGSNIIGRATDADFRLPDTGVSRKHAEITWDGADAVLVDLRSTNGTTVNDTPVENWLLADGDVITLGHSHIEVRITGPAGAGAAARPTSDYQGR